MRRTIVGGFLVAAAVVVVATGCTGEEGAATHNDEASDPQGATVVAVDYSYPEAPRSSRGA